MIIALSGPSGIGKGYIKNALMSEHSDIGELVWLTTRKLREGEKNRQSISQFEFECLDSHGELVLRQDMFGHSYALQKNDVLRTEGVWLTEIHPFVAKQAIAINPQIKLIGVITDDIGLLRHRLANVRKTESPEEIELRIAKACEEIESIRKNRSLYTAVIEVSRENEADIAQIANEIYLSL